MIDHGRPVLAVDIGGTKLAAALVGPDGTVLRRQETPTPAAPPGAPEVVGAALAGLLRAVVAGDGRDGEDGEDVGNGGNGGNAAPAAVGVASAGPLDVAAGTVSPVNIPAWRGFPVLDLVAEAVPGAPALLLGDAVAAAAGEQWRGAGRDSAAMIGIVVSTGIGGGLVLGGTPYPGPTGNAGHIGHIVADPAGEPCPCGATGCVETMASGPAMVRWARGQGWPGADARELTAAARAGDPVALAAVDRAAGALACGIVTVAVLCDLDLAVIGGGVAAAGEVLFAPLRRAVATRAHLGYVRRLRVVPAALGRDAGLVGAARAALGAPAGSAG
ncbi:sugar kinase [Sphaerisporangium rufum]|uniref:Sugar kinase n=1 Tax=Sphaerisporangium rufum TaxID=1381558 RepID=A0A919R3D8_9ACTN|nr:ROK family protein [Sphaerisporangium rufum]GII76297.1 sugar kinase [Sphaerisporangium rufum]